MSDLKESASSLRSAALRTVFEGVFVHRYRDCEAVIRADALTLYGSWLVAAPEALLANNYLK